MSGCGLQAAEQECCPLRRVGKGIILAAGSAGPAAAHRRSAQSALESRQEVSSNASRTLMP